MKVKYSVLPALFVFILFLSGPLCAQRETKDPTIYSNIGLGFGARALGMGGAFIALADDITAINFNPAGLAQLLKPEISLGFKFGGITNKYAAFSRTYSGVPSVDNQIVTQGAVDLKYNQFVFDYGGFVLPLNMFNIPIAIGFAYQKKLPSSYSYSLTYPYKAEFTDYTDYYYGDMSYENLESSGGYNSLSFSLASKLADFFYLGFNINYWTGSVTTDYGWGYDGNHYWYGNPFYFETLDYTDNRKYSVSGISFDAGLLLKFDMVSLGFVYKSKFTPSLDYTYDIEQEESYGYIPGTVYILSGSAGGTEKASITWPYSLGGGIAFRPVSALTITADFFYTAWSGGLIDWEDTSWTDTGYPVDEPQNSYQIRGGMEYLIVFEGGALPLRFGGFLDKQIFLDIDDEPLNFIGLTFGTGLVFKNFVWDVAGVFRLGSYKSSDYRADNNKFTSWNVVSSLSFRFDIK
ncbi:MAG: outer membrane protein transport protein [Candidatus Aminicenantes bacterium]|nr:outer membrane protein transport protein [Candidatus Aminicenantes bacterium]